MLFKKHAHRTFKNQFFFTNQLRKQFQILKFDVFTEINQQLKYKKVSQFFETFFNFQFQKLKIKSEKNQERSEMKNRKALKKDSQANEVRMSIQNLKICIKNQEGYQTPCLNNSLHLQFYSFTKIQNLDYFKIPTLNEESLKNSLHDQNDSNNQNDKHQVETVSQFGINTVFLNNNLLSSIDNLSSLINTLVTLNLSHNQITKFQNLSQLVHLCILDLSHNKLKQIKDIEIVALKSLKNLNLAWNLFTSKDLIKGITSIGKNLETLDLRNNQCFMQQQQKQFVSEVLQQMKTLKVLILKDTPIARMLSAYRKQIILAIPSLNFLDQRPVTQDQRTLAQAWKLGGLVEQRQARKRIGQKKNEKNTKIMQQIQQRNQLIEEKVSKIFFEKAKRQIEELENLKRYVQHPDFQLVDSTQQSVVKLKIQELQRYLQLFRQQCKNLDLDKQLGLKDQQLPKMLIQKRSSQCIYIYNVSQFQIPLIKQKYYPDEPLPLIAVNYQKPKQLQWIQEYDQILETTYKLCKGNWQIIVPSFNLQIYEFDLEKGRKLKRFALNLLEQNYKKHQKAKNRSQNQGNDNNNQEVYMKSNTIANPNNLDCLD